jgi:ABC-2 type transport system ATP-binding protein/lipopolysaccharide transport system ATP-binding protein
MEVIRLENVSKVYKRFSQKHRFATLKSAIVKGTLFKDLNPDLYFPALQNINLSIEEGKTVGIIGANGSGKSTLLKLIAGITKPTSGKIEVKGRVSALIELGAGFHPEISGRENVYINGIMLGLSKKEISEKFDEIVKFAELEDFIDEPVKTYSSGMYMRLGFAVAINVNPDILLIDEVLAVGDASFIPKCLEKIAEFKKKRKTIVFVSHALDTVTSICDEVVWLKKGEIQIVGDPKKVVDAYLQDVLSKEEKRFMEAHKAVPITEQREGRWGSQEIVIKDVKLYGSDGKEKYVFQSGEDFLIEMDVYAEKEIEDFVFGIGIFSADGIRVYGTNTQLEDMKPLSFQGEGKVVFRINGLDLIDGTYFLDVAAVREDGYPYDYHRSLYTFKVYSKKKDVGLWRPKHSWFFSSNIQFETNGEKI